MKTTQIAAALALENIKNGVVPVVFGSQKPKELKKSRFGIVSISFLVSITLILAAVALWDRRFSISGKVCPINDCFVEFQNDNGCYGCKTNSLGFFSLKLNRGVYKITLSGKNIPYEYLSTNTTPFRIKINRNLSCIMLQVR